MSATHIEDIAGRIKPRTASNLLLWGVVGFITIFILWASFTELERTVVGVGKVIPSSQLQVVSNLEGGVIETILVRSGQDVRAGQELIRLDPTQTGAELGSGEASLSALYIKIARLQAEVEGRPTAYPPATTASAAEQIRIEQALHASRLSDLSANLTAAQARIAQAERAVAEARASYQARVSAAQSRASEAAILRPLVERGIEPRLSLSQAEGAAAVARSEAAAAAAMIARTQASVAEARAASTQMRQAWRAQAATELAAAQAEMDARRRTIPALAERVQRTVIRAPVAGRINRVLVTTPGAAIQPSQPLLEMVPSEDSLLIAARVRPQDIGSVRLDQTARVGITAYDPAVFGRLEGRVISISPDAVVDQQTGESFYEVLIRTNDRALHDRSGRALPIGVGMVADVSLVGENRTVLQYILSPITKLGESVMRE